MLQRHVQLVVLGPIVLRSAGEDLVDDTGERDGSQVVVDDEPLVVPPGELLGTAEHDVVPVVVVEPERAPVGGDRVHDLVVEPEERGVELGDEEVLVVAKVADERPGVPVRVVPQFLRHVVHRDHAGCQQGSDARKVPAQVGLGRDLHPGDPIALGVLAEPEVDAVVEAVVVVVGVDDSRPVPVQAVQVEVGTPKVLQTGGDRARGDGSQIGLGDVAGHGVSVGVGRHVVVDELAPVGVDGRDVRVDPDLRVGGLGGRVVDHRRAEHVQEGHDSLGVAAEVGVGVCGQLWEEVVERRLGRVVGQVGHDHVVHPAGRVLGARDALVQDMTAVLQIEHQSLSSSRDPRRIAAGVR